MPEPLCQVELQLLQTELEKRGIFEELLSVKFHSSW